VKALFSCLDTPPFAQRRRGRPSSRPFSSWCCSGFSVIVNFKGQ
jgi:hypothetical protein